MQIVVSGANYYEWQNSELNETSSPQVYISPEQSLVYQVVGFNNLNCSDTIETTVFLYPSVQANFIVNPVLLTSDSPIINITNTSLNAVNSIWNYGDGLIEENNELFFDYQYAYTEGNYLLSLNVISEEGCIDSTQAVIQVKGAISIIYPIHLPLTGMNLIIHFYPSLPWVLIRQLFVFNL